MYFMSVMMQVMSKRERNVIIMVLDLVRPKFLKEILWPVGKLDVSKILN